jgi:cytochrome c-type biogenesis protein
VTAAHIRRTLVIAGLLVIALGAVALTGLRQPAAPHEALRAYLPTITLPAVILAGAVDGINPCAFTVLLLFVTALLATLQAGGQSSVRSVRLRLVGMGSIYIAAIFLTYLALGIGLLSTLDIFTRGHVPARLGALLALLFGLWMLKDVFVPELGWKLQAPPKVGAHARQAAKKATIPALVAAGFLIGLCTVPCSGAVYLAVLSLLALQPTALLGYGYLLLYNVVFILPLVAILVLASARPTLNQLTRWNLHHKHWVKLTLGSSVVIMGLIMLAVV